MINAGSVKDIIKQHSRYTDLEFIIGTKCQNACRYCYRVAYQNQGECLPLSIDKMKLYFSNAVDMGMIPEKLNSITLFGGDPIVDIDYFVGFLKEFNKHCYNIIIPTNGRIIENLSIPDIERIHEASDYKLALSLSIDGPIVENTNRPLSTFGKMQGFKQDRNWEYLIQLSRRFNYGFHPMLYLETAHTWFDTWKWFITNDLPVYLLEVRHGHPDDAVLVEGVYQIAKILSYCAKHNIPNKFNGTNLGTIHRGLGCSALNTIHINLDGCTYFCHRVLKESFKIADLVTKQINLNHFIAMGAGFDYHNSFICMECPIRELCSGACVGMVDEYWDRFGAVSIPIPSMCRYYLLKYGYLVHLALFEWANPQIDIDALNDAVFNNFGEDIYNQLDRRLASDDL